MIKKLVDYGLHMTYQLHFFILKSYISQPHLYRLRYELFFSILFYYCYNLISLVPTWPPISTSFFWSRSSTWRIWVEQAVYFNPRLMRKNYLQTNAFLNLVMVEQEEYPHTLQRKVTGKRATNKVVRRRLPGCDQVWLLECQHQFLPSRFGDRVTLQCIVVTIQG